jgi:hypothetical protein
VGPQRLAERYSEETVEVDEMVEVEEAARLIQSFPFCSEARCHVI